MKNCVGILIVLIFLNRLPFIFKMFCLSYVNNNTKNDYAAVSLNMCINFE